MCPKPYGKGDIPVILDCLAKNVHWEQWADNSAQRAGVPWLQAQKGKAAALEFFQVMGSLQADAQALAALEMDNCIAWRLKLK